MAKEYTHLEGLDYESTFIHVAKMTIVRYLLVVAPSKQWHLIQLDVHDSFIHVDFEKNLRFKTSFKTVV